MRAGRSDRILRAPHAKTSERPMGPTRTIPQPALLTAALTAAATIIAVAAIGVFAPKPALPAPVPGEGPEPGTIESPALHSVRIGDSGRQAALGARGTWRGFQSRYGAWSAIWNEVTGSPHRAFGPPIALRAR